MTPPPPDPTPAAVARVVSGVLARLGFRVSVKPVPAVTTTAGGPVVVVTAVRPTTHPFPTPQEGRP